MLQNDESIKIQCPNCKSSKYRTNGWEIACSECGLVIWTAYPFVANTKINLIEIETGLKQSKNKRICEYLEWLELHGIGENGEKNKNNKNIIKKRIKFIENWRSLQKR